MDISFIIPVFNEETHIVNCIVSIRNVMRNLPYEFEFIIIDDASVDNSPLYASTNIRVKDEIPRDSYDYLIELDEKVYPSIVRNIGAKKASGNIFVFLDADVVVTPEWGSNVKTAFDIVQNDNVITGSTVSTPSDAPWLIRAWFAGLDTKRRNYINGAHIIVSRNVFEELDGFDELLETGEDTDFSYRASEAGKAVHLDQALKVIHYGYPDTLKKFFKRERWHGRGNFTTFKSMKTKTSIFVLTLFLMFMLGISLLFVGNIWGIIAFVFAFMGTSLMYGIKRMNKLSDLIPCTFLSGTFFLGRMTALIDMIIFTLTNGKLIKYYILNENSGVKNDKAL